MAYSSESKIERLFWGALIISIVIHVVTVIYLSIKKFNVWNRDVKQIEVVYDRVTPKEKKKEKPKSEVKIIQEKQPEKKVDVLSKKETLLPNFMENKPEVSKLSNPMRIEKKENPVLKSDGSERLISIPILESEKISTPSYLHYNDAVRSKIISVAYSLVNTSNLTNGDVYLTFVVASDGNLKAVQVLDSRSNATPEMCELGLKTIRESQPFAPFPKDLNYGELTFKVIISFKSKK